VRRRIGFGLAMAAVAAVLIVPSTASAGHQLDSNCSPTGDYCTGVFASHGSVTAILRTFSFRGAYELCIRPPAERFDCQTFTLRSKSHGIYEGRVGLARQFGPLRKGRYDVKWSSSGYAIGPTLHFHVG
jgi:hypothetical protein